MRCRVFVRFPLLGGGLGSFSGTVTGVSRPGTQRGLFVAKDNGELTYVARATYRRMWWFVPYRSTA